MLADGKFGDVQPFHHSKTGKEEYLAGKDAALLRTGPYAAGQGARPAATFHDEKQLPVCSHICETVGNLVLTDIAPSLSP